MNKNKWMNRLFYLSGIVFFLMVFRGLVISKGQIRVGQKYDRNIKAFNELNELNDRWRLIHEDGSEEAIQLPCRIPKEDGLKISRDVKGIFREGDIIQFDNNREGVIVQADEEILYEVNTTALNRQLNFTDYQLITMPEGISSLTLYFVHTETEDYELPAVYYGSYACARKQIICNDLLTLIILVVMGLGLGLICVILIFCRVKKLPSGLLMDLAIFILTAIMWGSADSYLMVLTPLPQEVIGLVCYLSIIALPLPMCNFIWVSLGKRYSALRIISIAGAINLILEAVLSCFGILQLQYTFYSAHILIIAMIIAALYGICMTRKEKVSADMDILYWGIILLAFVALLSILLYWKKGGFYYRNCMLIGIMLFSAILICSIMVRYLNQLQADQLRISESLIYERLSMFDELTGLANRRAFEKKLQEIEENLEVYLNAVMIMLDVNGLKMVNDQYGHSAGDDLIVSASRVIEKTYGADGFCYRIGGDEFAVILQNTSKAMSVYDRFFDEEVERVNQTSRWKLSAARGISCLSHLSGQHLSISDWKQEADVNMYRAKVMMKGSHSRDRAKDLRDIINCIITTVEAKDMYTAAHSVRVREISYCIASKLGVSDSTIQNLENAAHLHDIGKISIPDRVLLKTDRLTDEEYEIIKKHSEIGANIIGQAKGMQEIANIVLHHHERWDGKGYPDGLTGEEIPLESRIIALADSIDAITSKRVYRESRSMDECRLEIERNAGLMYDPAITQIVLQNWSAIVDAVMVHPKHLIDVQER